MLVNTTKQIHSQKPYETAAVDFNLLTSHFIGPNFERYKPSLKKVRFLTAAIQQLV